jgi:MFS family permease
MSTLIVGPFYLTRGLALGPATMGLVMTLGPVLTAIAGVPSGRLVDQVGPHRTATIGLAVMTVGTILLASQHLSNGVRGYLGATFFLTVGYALFQAANNTAVMSRADASERGLVAGVLSLARNLGLIAGASLMGAVFAISSGVRDITTAQPAAISAGMRFTFVVAATLVVAATALFASAQFLNWSDATPRRSV